MFDRFNKANRNRANKEKRSALEEQVELALTGQGLSPSYESEKFAYVLHRKYRPDFKIESDHGPIHIEVKGWWPSKERSKLLAVFINNPTIRLFVALQRPQQKISKQSKTTYAMWCDKHFIPWCPIPIQPEYMNKWLNGERPTFRAPETIARAATERRSTRTVQSGVTSVSGDRTQMELLGRLEG